MGEVAHPRGDRWLAVLLGVVFALWMALVGWSAAQDPVVTVDRPLPDLPARTLDGRRLDRAFFGDDDWIVALWMPG